MTRSIAVIPAVDIAQGRCVRLTRGKMQDMVVYYEDPLEAAKRWVGEGAEMLHIVDLDAAVGTADNSEAVKKVVKGAGIPCQVGGGIRSVEKAKEYADAGVARVIFGTAALELKIIIKALEVLGADMVMAAVDHIMGNVAIKGWKEQTGIDAMLLCARLEDAGVKNILMTSIDRDGTMKGPSLEYSLKAAGYLKGSLYLAGGFSKIEDLLPLKGSGIAGVVLGKSLYEGKIDLREAMEAMA